jgi:TPR repeat protein
LFPSLNEAAAFCHLETAARLGDAQAAAELFGRRADPVWKDRLVELARQGDVAAIETLATRGADAFFMDFGLPLGMELLALAAKTDSLEAMLLYAAALAEDRREEDAKAFWRRAASLGSANAHHELALREPDPQKQIRHFEAAAGQSHVESIKRLIVLYAEQGDPSRCEPLLRQLAERGDLDAIKRLYERAVESGDHDAAIRYLGKQPMDEAKRAYRLSSHYEQIGDEQEAIRQLETAAAGNVPAAMLELGLRWLSGRGFPAHPDIAAAWIAKAAEVCHPEAMYRMGCLYETGEGVPQDEALAVFWFDHAASYGHMDAKKRRAKYKKTLFGDWRKVR